MSKTNYFFLLGSERSGTNFITKVLDNHPNICGPSPTHLIRTFSKNLRNYGNLNIDKNWKTFLTDISDFLKYQLGEWQTKVSFEELLKNIHDRNLNSVIRFVYEKEGNIHKKENIFIKENQVYGFLSFLSTSFSAAKYIYIIRDPRDNILSFKKSPNHQGSIIKGTKIWKNDQTEFIKTFFYLKETNSIKIIKYEDLTANIENTLINICNFLNIDYSAEMLNFHSNKLTQKNAKKLKNWENLGKPVIKTNFNKYKKELSESEIKYIEYICKDEMNFFKYKFDYNASDNIDEITEQINKNKNYDTLKYNQNEEIVRQKRLDIIQTILSRKLEY